MNELIYLHCRSCGERLVQRHLPYCSACNLRLAYLSMPLLLGALLTGRFPAPPVPAFAVVPVPGRYLVRGYDDENALHWE